MRIQQHRRYLEESGGLETRRKRRLEQEIMDIAARRLREQILAPRTETKEFSTMLDDVAERRMDPYQVAEKILPGAGSAGK